MQMGFLRSSLYQIQTFLLHLQDTIHLTSHPKILTYLRSCGYPPQDTNSSYRLECPYGFTLSIGDYFLICASIGGAGDFIPPFFDKESNTPTNTNYSSHTPISIPPLVYRKIVRTALAKLYFSRSE